jgi:serralysin
LQQSGGSGSGGGSASVQVPGPSAALFASPYYKCVTNYYVSTSGSDSNDGQTKPWQTLQQADSAKVSAGSCINVAPGTYDGVLLHNGGNAATATGYVVYRCQTLDACIIKGDGGVNGSSAFDFVQTTNGTPPNFIQIDGFEMVGQGTFYPIGVNVYNGDGSRKVASHHVWVLNSIVHGFGQSGLQLNNSEYLYAIHNTLYGNSNTVCDAQGSGISYWAPNAVAGYNPTADDRTNPNSLLGPTWVNGSTFFHNVIEWNVTYNNALTQCNTANSPGDTDGNGIIMDSFLNNNYPNETLVAFNVTYNNGGGGIHVFYSGNVTVANNSCFNNYLDPANNATWRGCIDDADGFSNTYLNNIALAIPAITTTCNISPPFTRFNSAVLASPQGGSSTWTNNITDMIGVGCNGEIDNNGDSYSATTNKESTVPRWVDVGTSAVGIESTPPVGANFALEPGSPAIGYGLTQPYLAPQSVDAGACSSSLTTCP